MLDFVIYFVLFLLFLLTVLYYERQLVHYDEDNEYLSVTIRRLLEEKQELQAELDWIDCGTSDPEEVFQRNMNAIDGYLGGSWLRPVDPTDAA